MRGEPAPRRQTVTREFECVDTALGGRVKLAVSVSHYPGTDSVCEVFFSQRGKSGSALNKVLDDMGIWISRMIQGRDDPSR